MLTSAVLSARPPVPRCSMRNNWSAKARYTSCSSTRVAIRTARDVSSSFSTQRLKTVSSIHSLWIHYLFFTCNMSDSWQVPAPVSWLSFWPLTTSTVYLLSTRAQHLMRSDFAFGTLYLWRAPDPLAANAIGGGRRSTRGSPVPLRAAFGKRAHHFRAAHLSARPSGARRARTCTSTVHYIYIYDLFLSLLVI